MSRLLAVSNLLRHSVSGNILVFKLLDTIQQGPESRLCGCYTIGTVNGFMTLEPPSTTIFIPVT